MVVDIGGDGLAVVNLNASVVKGLNSISLPIEPIPETIVVKVDGKRLTPIYYNNTMVIPSDAVGTVYITYTANVTLVGGRMTLKIGSSRVLLRAVNNIVLLSIPENIEEAYTEDEILIIKFTGPAEISYTIAETKEKPSGNIFTSIAGLPWPYILGGALSLGVALTIIYYIRRRMRGLDSTDKAIIKYLRRKGGQALQSEIMNELKIPKTTLWRHVKRLEREGYVTVEQVGRVNIVKLRK